MEWTNDKRVPGAYVLVKGKKYLDIKSGWDNSSNTIKFTRKRDPPDVATAEFKHIPSGSSTKYVYPPDLKKCESFIIEGGYVTSANLKRKGKKGGGGKNITYL